MSDRSGGTGGFPRFSFGRTAFKSGSLDRVAA